MLVLVLIMKNVSDISCKFCNKDFIFLGRNTWRLKQESQQLQLP